MKQTKLRTIHSDLATAISEKTGAWDLVGVSDKRVSQLTLAEIAIDITMAIRAVGRLKYYRKTELRAYANNRWIPFDPKTDLPRVISYLLEMKGVGLVYRMPSSVSSIVGKIMQDAGLDEFKPQKRYIVCNNCVLDTADGNLYDFDPKFETLVHLNVFYDAKARCDLWERTLREIILDEPSISFLQEFLGLIFVDRSELNVPVCLHLVGSGANGKSVVYELIKQLLGKYCSTMELSEICTHPKNEYYRAELDGKLLNFCADMSKNDFSNGIFKRLVSGESVSARKPGGEVFDIENGCIYMDSLNEIPVITDNTDGFWRRNRFIVFGRTFSEAEQDKSLVLKLKREIPGIFAWILKGRERIVKNQGVFTFSELMDTVKEQTRRDSSSILSWCYERGYVAPKPEFEDGKDGYSIIRRITKNLYADYTLYCSEIGVHPKKQANFVADMKRMKFEYSRCVREKMDVSSGFFIWHHKNPLWEFPEELAESALPF